MLYAVCVCVWWGRLTDSFFVCAGVGGTWLEVKCLKGYVAVKSLRATDLRQCYLNLDRKPRGRMNLCVRPIVLSAITRERKEVSCDYGQKRHCIKEQNTEKLPLIMSSSPCGTKYILPYTIVTTSGNGRGVNFFFFFFVLVPVRLQT